LGKREEREESGKSPTSAEGRGEARLPYIKGKKEKGTFKDETVTHLIVGRQMKEKQDSMGGGEGHYQNTQVRTSFHKKEVMLVAGRPKPRQQGVY